MWWHYCAAPFTPGENVLRLYKLSPLHIFALAASRTASLPTVCYSVYAGETDEETGCHPAVPDV